MLVISQDGRVRQVMPDDSLVEIHRSAPMPDVDPELLKPAPRDPAQGDPCPACMAAEFRNKASADSAYVGEDEFMRKFRNRIGVEAPAPEPNGPSPCWVLYGRGRDAGSSRREE